MGFGKMGREISLAAGLAAAAAGGAKGVDSVNKDAYDQKISAAASLLTEGSSTAACDMVQGADATEKCRAAVLGEAKLSKEAELRGAYKTIEELDKMPIRVVDDIKG